MILEEYSNLIKESPEYFNLINESPRLVKSILNC